MSASMIPAYARIQTLLSTKVPGERMSQPMRKCPRRLRAIARRRCSPFVNLPSVASSSLTLYHFGYTIRGQSIGSLVLIADGAEKIG